MSEEMILSICKSAAYGETAEKTAEMHGCTAAEVQQVWNDNPDVIIDYQAFNAEMGCSH